ncbi:MAG: hypothetical protein H0X40_14975 [Chthoniobacterales bacterium]|nr:hypothetical protein [Chthoniobacterales bacterium]
MKIQRKLRPRINSIGKSRWATYTAAGIATALGGAHAADAEIHYSGPLHEKFDALPQSTQEGFFPLEGGARLAFDFGRAESGDGAAFFDIEGGVLHDSLVESFRGTQPGGVSGLRYPSKLAAHDPISSGNFVAGSASPFAFLAFHGGLGGSQWLARGPGFIGFRFDAGNGIQYGWARVKMFGAPDNRFQVIDYAWGDPGEPVSAGQLKSRTQAPQSGALGFLALGAAGLAAWRRPTPIL